jgi:hypothetical protein
MFTDNQLALVLTQIVNFGWSNYTPDGKPDQYLQENLGYQCACFVAQHTVEGSDGVEIDEAMTLMKIDKEMNEGERFALAMKFIRRYGGAK